MNNKAIIEFGFRIIWRIMEILEGVIRRRRNTLLNLHNSSQDTQPHSLLLSCGFCYEPTKEKEFAYITSFSSNVYKTISAAEARTSTPRSYISAILFPLKLLLFFCFDIFEH